MNNKYDIQPFAQSLLADVRARADQQTASMRKDRDAMMRKMRDREKRTLGYVLGAKLLMGIGNNIVNDATNNFLSSKPFLDNNVKFKTALDGATRRQADRQQALEHAGGVDDYWTQFASKELTSTFAQTIPDNVSPRHRAQLMYNEAYKAGQLLKKQYADNEKYDLDLISAVGAGGQAAYTEAMKSSRPSTLGGALYSGVKNLFVKDGDPLDNSIRGNELMSRAENVKAYGALRKAGLEPWSAKEKVEELIAKGKELPQGIVSSEIKTIKGVFDPLTNSNRDISVQFTTMTDGSVVQTNLTTGTETNNQILTMEKKVGLTLKNRPDEVSAFATTVQQFVSEEDNKVYQRYVKAISKDSTDQQRLDATADLMYTQMLLTKETLMNEIGINDRQATQIAIKAHAINQRSMLDSRWSGDTLQPQNGMLVGNDLFHPSLALIAMDEIEEAGESVSPFSPAVRARVISLIDQMGDKYDARLSSAASSTLDRLMKNNPSFNRELSTGAGAGTGTGTSTGAVAGSDTGSSDEVIASTSAPIFFGEDILEWRKSLPLNRRKHMTLNTDTMKEKFGDEIAKFVGDKYSKLSPVSINKFLQSNAAQRLGPDELEEYMKLPTDDLKNIYLQTKGLI